MKSAYLSIFTIVLVLHSGILLISSPGQMNFASARYTPADTQTQANANECNTGTNCAINSPQTQGDGSASSPTNLQISGLRDEQRQEPQVPPIVTVVIVTKIVECPEGFSLVCPRSEDFTLRVVSENLVPVIFQGDSRTGTFVQLSTGFFSVEEVGRPPDPPGLRFAQSVGSGDCQGAITRDQDPRPLQCTIRNQYERTGPMTSPTDYP